MDIPGRLIVADPTLVGYAGHSWGYSNAVANAAVARGIPSVILAGRSFVPGTTGGSVPCIAAFGSSGEGASKRRLLRRTIHSIAANLPYDLAHRLMRILRLVQRKARLNLLHRPRFGEELSAALADIGGGGGDYVLLHTVPAADLESLIPALPSDSVGALAIVLRHTVEEMDSIDAATIPIGELLRRLHTHFSDRLLLFADTEGLARMYGDLLTMCVRPVPPPVVVPSTRMGVPGALPHLVFAGGARREKGYGLLPPLIRRLRGRARFTVHCGAVTSETDPLVQQAHRELLALAGPDVTLLQRALDPGEYIDLLGSADLLLLPYDGAAYGPRSSGILGEARALGVPAIVPAGTWMEQAAGPAQEVVFAGEADFSAAVERTLGSLAAITATYRQAAPEWRARHSPAALLDALLGPVPRFHASRTA